MRKLNLETIDSLSLQDLHEDAELIPLLTPEDEDAMHKEALPESLPILPLRNTVLFPGVVIPISAGRDKSIQLINEINKGSKVIGVVTQKDETNEEPEASDLYSIGTVARILRVLKMPDGNITVIIQGKKRFEIKEIVSTEPYLMATVNNVEEIKPDASEEEFNALIDSIKEVALDIIKYSPNIPSEASMAIKNIESNSFLVNFVSSNLNIKVAGKQALLEIHDLKKRAFETLRHMKMEFQRLTLRNDIQSKVESDISKQQREYFLHQQMKTIQEELGGVSHDEEIDEMIAKSKEKIWDEKVDKNFEKEIGKLQRMNQQVSEYVSHIQE